MTNVLIINSSPALEGSVTRDLTAHLETAVKAKAPDAVVVHRDVGQTPPPVLDAAMTAAFRSSPDTRTAEQEELLVLSNTLIAELKAADVVVIGAPMHNFSVTASLKTWIDHIARAGETFQYTAEGPKGLLDGKKAVVLTARGGAYKPGLPTNFLDQQEPHLRTVLGFIGIKDVDFVYAERTAASDEEVAPAKTEIDGLVANLV